MKNFFLLTACFLLSLAVSAKNDTAERERSITLSEAIALARSQSVDAAVALNELRTVYWEYRTFRADLLPEVNFTGTLPNYNKSYSTYQNSDGSYSFVRNNTLGLSGQLSIDQNIWFTGGKLSLASSLNYLKQLGTGGDRQFMSVPISLELTQPIFGVNSLRWNRRIEPVRYAEVKAAFISATEEVTMKTITYFFQLLLAKEALATAQQNKKNADRLYEVAIAKRKMGQISENDLLQLKLNSLQGKADVTEAESNLNAKMFQLRSFLSVSEQESLNPVLPASVPNIKMEYDYVLNKALERNSFAQNIRRRQLEADYEVATARGNLRSIDLFASVGYTGQNREFSSAYQDLLDNQIVKVGVKIPILDWGKRRGKVRVARSNREVVLSKLRQEQMNFNQDIFLLVANFNNQAQQLGIAEEADIIAEKRYQTSVETFMIGKISTLDLNDAQNSKDKARQKHISELYYFWYYFYQLRSLTLWDFQHNTELEADFDDIIRG
ncbi:TolC family protein [Bacteroides helcogenes]|uniref:Outer membrane efflux protein n=1 Tax=Bacteroides helcogenes (strain ATCC 35417 / DSM 20613 / JCM 6297 / CCUG 15421 / P 36-108) TaxID=693979 RepID=E6SPT9_BACT6|nr:TolC family protein [Bacteroides helcogenes]ADV44918.1 outer membrane efflux protein [Bacteroides helcogenes P 36-108]